MMLFAADLFLRFTWSLTLIPRGSGSPLPEALTQYLDPVLAALEILRRCMWGCLRLESEQLQRTTRAHKLDSPSFHHSPHHLHHHDTNGYSMSGEDSSNRGWQVVFEVTLLAMVVLGVGGLAAMSSHSN
jgi:hypothetical protein